MVDPILETCFGIAFEKNCTVFVAAGFGAEEVMRRGSGLEHKGSDMLAAAGKGEDIVDQVREPESDSTRVGRVRSEDVSGLELGVTWAGRHSLAEHSLQEAELVPLAT